MMSLKEEAIYAIQTLPENAGIDDIMYRLYVIDKINKGQKAVKEKRILSSEELKLEVNSW